MLQLAQIAMLLSGSIVSAPIMEEGMATYYHDTGPLYAHPSYTYHDNNGLQWCAVNVQGYLSGKVLPGDRLIVYFLDYGLLFYCEAWDAGPFNGYYIADYPDLPILVDIPQHLWPLSWERSARVQVINVSAMSRYTMSN